MNYHEFPWNETKAVILNTVKLKHLLFYTVKILLLLQVSFIQQLSSFERIYFISCFVHCEFKDGCWNLFQISFLLFSPVISPSFPVAKWLPPSLPLCLPHFLLSFSSAPISPFVSAALFVCCCKYIRREPERSLIFSTHTRAGWEMYSLRCLSCSEHCGLAILFPAVHTGTDVFRSFM